MVKWCSSCGRCWCFMWFSVHLIHHSKYIHHCAWFKNPLVPIILIAISSLDHSRSPWRVHSEIPSYLNSKHVQFLVILYAKPRTEEVLPSIFWLTMNPKSGIRWWPYEVIGDQDNISTSLLVKSRIWTPIITFSHGCLWGDILGAVFGVSKEFAPLT